jgi:hypothetical protein
MTTPGPLPPRLQRRPLLLWGGLAVLGLTPAMGACAEEPLPDPRQPPPGFVPLRERGAFELALSDCEAALHGRLAQAHGPLGYARHLAPAGSQTLAQLEAALQASLGEGWSPLATAAPRPSGFELRAWQRRSWIGTRPVLAAAWLTATPVVGGTPAQLLVLAATTPRR